MSIREEAKRDAEFDRLLTVALHTVSIDGTDLYAEDGMQAAYEMGKRHEAERAPRWHDAPTCAGVWVAQKEFSHTLHLSEGFEPLDAWKNYRWYGPIPADEVNP
jgi:hypothetical protein